MSAETLCLPDAPAVEGLVFCTACPEDAGAIYAVRAGCVAHDQVDLLSTSEGLPGRDEIHSALAQVVAAGQQDRRLVAQVGEEVVGYSLVNSWPEDDGRWVYLILGWVLPEWRGRGLGTAMLHWGERTARRLATEQHPGELFELAANASSTELDTTALLLHEGYAAGYTVLEMELDKAALPPVSPLPPGIDVRPVLPAHYASIARSMQEAYSREYADNRFQETCTFASALDGLSEPGHDPSLWQVAWAGDQVAGGVIPLIDRGRAVMYDICVRSAWRRQGLARALLTCALWDLDRRGVEVIRLCTVAEFRTRARDLYTSVGFRLIKEFPRYRKSPGP